MRKRLWMVALSAAAFVLLNAGTALAAKPKPPHIVVGADHTTSAVFSYANAIRERVFIPVPGVDQDGDGVFDRVSIDIIRPAETNQGMKVPAIIDPSPYYTSLGRGNESQFIHTTAAGNLDLFPLFYDNYFVPRGYAVILADAVGTAFSSGCPLHGGPGDLAGFTAVIDWLMGRSPGFDKDGNSVAATWANGKNAMIGKSYDGTFANGVASTGVDGLTTIVPISAISDWYDYSRMGGVRFNSHYPAFLSDAITDNQDASRLGVVPPDNNAKCLASRNAMSAVGPNGDGDSDGDIDAFWQARNYNLDVGNVHASVFESQGLNDDNVRPNHFAQWWNGLTAHNVPRKLWLSQEGHVDPFDYRRGIWVDTLHRWFDHWLYGLPNGIMQQPKIDIETGPNTWTTAKAWPLQQTRPVGIYLQGTTAGAKGVLALRSGGGTSSLTFTDANLSETNYLSLTNTQANKLTFLSPPLKHDLRVSGTPVVDIRASLSKTQSNLSAFLVDYGGGVLRVFRTSNEGVQNLTTRSCWGDSTTVDSACYLDVIERTTTPTSWRVGKGLLDSSNRDSLFSGAGSPVTIGQTYEFKWPLLPNDFTFVAGHQLGVILGANFSGYGSVNGTTATAITVDTKLSKILLPITGGRAAARASGAFDGSPVVKIKTPPEGAVYRLGKVVHASYKCTSAATTIASCVGTVPKGAAIDTSTQGSHTFTVTATDANGTTTTVTTPYTVTG
jgi:X-Pro dipeptidyl-peptidase